MTPACFEYGGKGKVIYAKNTEATENLFSQELNGKNKRNTSVLPPVHRPMMSIMVIRRILDPETETGLAKPYYEAVVIILEKSNKNKSLFIECYSYLGYCYYLKGAMADLKAH